MFLVLLWSSDTVMVYFDSYYTLTWNAINWWSRCSISE